MTPEALATEVEARLEGLSSEQARARLAAVGRNRLHGGRMLSGAAMLWRQVANPLLLLLIVAALASALSGAWTDALIVVVIVVTTIGIGFSRERDAQSAVAALQAEIRSVTLAVRDGVPGEVPIEEIVPGDVVILAAGMLVPGDALVLEAAECYVNEATLTGESFPVRKQPGLLPVATELSRRTNSVFLGTSVRSGTMRCLVAATGVATQFGSVAERLGAHTPETEFERGIRRFGYLLTSAMLVLVLLVFAVHVMRGRPPVETLLFAVALAVGLSPELLPAILSVSLARGARMMARHGVVVRRLNAIENLGSMDVLCTDKTGTLTEGVVQLGGSYDADGNEAPAVLAEAARNASCETGVANPLAAAILAARGPFASPIRVGEIPFDHLRKRSGVVIDDEGQRRLIVKGAGPRVLDVCERLPDGTPIDDERRAALLARHDSWTQQGIRVLAIASRPVGPQATYAREDERNLTLLGWLTFLDQPKAGAREAVDSLTAQGVTVKMLSGDNRLVARHVAGLVGLRADRVLTGPEVETMAGPALRHAVDAVDVFAEVEPAQKERIILALKQAGHVVGFLGDGVNDAPAMHAADTSLSVEHAVDVTRETADFVLLRQNLDVIRAGIAEGRRTYANTLKYVLTTTSANLGNMVSMAAASLFLPFLPLTAGQILLNNFLSDIPAIGIAGDAVDPELVARPERWDMRVIGRFMVSFGALSSVFDLITFVILLRVFQVDPALFRTAWFTESLLSELAIALVVRTRRSCLRSRPGRSLAVLTAVTAVVAVGLPFVPGVAVLGFVPLPPAVLAMVFSVVAAYLVATELAKRVFFRAAEAPAR